MPAYFTRGSGPQRARRSTASGPTTTSSNVDRLARKFETAQARSCRAPIVEDAGARDRHHRLRHRATGRSTRAARPAARRKPGIETAYLRLRAYPFTAGGRRRSSRRYDRVYVVEQNRDAQMLIAAAAWTARRRSRRKLRSVLHYNGLPIDARSITDEILAQEGARREQRHRPAASRRGRSTDRHDARPRLQTPAEEDQPHRPRACSRTAAARRRSAPAAATTPSPSASSTRSSRWASTRSDVIKLSGIGCSSKSPAYFLGDAHGFNSVHGRMPSVGTGALLANRKHARDRRQRRRRHRRDRHRPVRAPDAAQPADHLHHRGQRLLRPDQGAVLADRRPRLDAEERRRQRPAADRHLRAGDRARRVVRGALVLRRQEAAAVAPQGGAQPPRHLR